MKAIFLLWLGWFVFVFGPIIRSPLGALADLSIVATTAYLGWSIASNARLHRSVAPFFYIAISLTSLAILNSLFASEVIDGSSVQAILRPVKGLLVFLGLYFAVTRLSRGFLDERGPRETYEMLLGVIYAAVLVHAAIIILQFIFPAFLHLTYQVIGGEDVLNINKHFRMPGLSGAGGAQLSATQGLGFLIGVHLALIRGRYLPYIMGNLLLVASFVLTGRTGFVLVGIAAVYWILSVFLGRKRRWRVRSPAQALLGVVWLIVALGVIFWTTHLISIGYADNQWFARAVDRTFKTYTDYNESGKLSDRTLNALATMFVVPSDPIRWVFGDARLYNNTLGVYYSDIGYIRLWWGYGLVGLTGYIAFYLLMAVQIGGRGVRRVMGGQNVAFGFCVLFAIFVLNFKEPFFFSRMSYPITLAAVMGLWWLTIMRLGKVNRTTADDVGTVKS